MDAAVENQPMIVAIASGKGGTGKTTVAVNLAVALDEPVQLLDCDVEEPNVDLFLKASITEREEVHAEVPRIDLARCAYCGQCQDICQFNALAVLPETRVVLTFPELCHSCGGCFAVCPESAVLPDQRLLGHLETGQRGNVRLIQGKLRVGEAMSPPLIRRVRQASSPNGMVIIDAPPGTSCPVIASLRGVDFVCLVTEPTPFGLNDLELAVGAVRKLKIPMGIVINRADVGDGRILEYARRESIPVLLEIPFERSTAETYARGEILVEAQPRWKERMLLLHEAIRSRVA
jgi:MinD superfamily P-loop ATPase